MTELLGTLIVIEGPPVAKGRPKFGRGRAYTPEATRSAEIDLKWALLSAGLRKPVAGDVAVTLRFFMEDEHRTDMDNCEKLVLDACNKTAWVDDRQVVEKHTYLVRSDPRPRTELTITELTTEGN